MNLCSGTPGQEQAGQTDSGLTAKTSSQADGEPKEEPAKTYSLADVRAQANALKDKFGIDALRDVFRRHGGEKLKDIPEGNYTALMGILRVISAKDEDGRKAAVRLTPDGAALETGRADASLELTCEVERPRLERLEDEPELPEHAHSALVDYICFRYLSTGNLAKQSRAQAYQSSFYTTARRLKPQGRGSVTRMKNLYAVTDIRGGW